MVDPIGRFANIQQVYGAQVRQNAGVEKAVERKSDRAETSHAAQRSEELRKALLQGAQDAPAVRADKVAEARRKLESGELLSDRVIEEIAERLASSILPA